jgi:hypothetical protein
VSGDRAVTTDSDRLTILGRLAADGGMWRDFVALCDCGGRVAGTDSEARAVELIARRFAELGAGALRREPVDYLGWRASSARLSLPDGAALPCHALLRTAPTSGGPLDAEIVDLGRGTIEAFEHAGEVLRGRIALARHEYMFGAGTIHRRRKYLAAVERGAAGFLIANTIPGLGPVAGSSGRGAEPGIPSLGIGAEAAARLAAAGRARIEIATEERPAQVDNLHFEIPGRGPEWIVLSAHLDGHALGESAMDNATGLAVALAVARALAPAIARCRRGLRVSLFSVEEWALTGSEIHVARIGEAERRRIRLDVNLDSIGGDARFAALTSGFARLEPFLAGAASRLGMSLATYRPLMANSDHYNFACAGIPAFRMVAGFDAPDSNLRYVLTSGDTRSRVAPAELKAAGLLVGEIVWAALSDEAADWR